MSRKPTNAKRQDKSEVRAIRQANAAIRLAEIEIAKGKRTGQGFGSVRLPGGAGKKK
jgi:hypothetical protein